MRVLFSVLAPDGPKSSASSRLIFRRQALTAVAAVLAAGVIAGRGALYFQGAILPMAILDLLALAAFICLAMASKQLVYFGLVALLPAVSLTYLAAGLIPHDLSAAIVLLMCTKLLHNLPERGMSRPLIYAAGFVFLLFIYLLSFLVFESFGDLSEMKAQFKAAYFLATAVAMALLFARVYQPGDDAVLVTALKTGVYAYALTAALGYLFPLASFTWEADTEFYFKSLFRYPGLSSSNYVANVVLLLVAMVWLLEGRLGRPRMLAWYLSVILVVAVLSQSRGFVLASATLVFMWGVQAAANGGRRFGPARTSLMQRYLPVAGVVILLGLAATNLPAFSSGLLMQFFDRFGSLAMENIYARIDEWRNTLQYFDKAGKSLLLGNHAFPEGIRPHNVLLSAVLLFGVPLALVIAAALVQMVIAYPSTLFIVVAAQTEILFGTGLYDSLVLMLIAILGANYANYRLDIRPSGASAAATAESAGAA